MSRFSCWSLLMKSKKLCYTMNGYILDLITISCWPSRKGHLERDLLALITTQSPNILKTQSPEVEMVDATHS